MDTKKLPKMPRPMCNYADHSYPAFSKAQMEEYALAAIAAAGAPDLRSAIEALDRYDHEDIDCGGQTVKSPTGLYLWRDDVIDLLASAAPVEARPLTPFEIVGIAKAEGLKVRTGQGAIRFARAIEARIKGRKAGSAS